MVTCRICGEKFEEIHWQHLKTHGFTTTEYKIQFPRAKTCSKKTSRKKSEAAKHGCTKEVKERISKANRKRFENPQQRAIMSEAQRKRFANPKARKEMSKACERSWTKKRKKRQVEIMRKRFLNPENRRKHSEAMKRIRNKMSKIKLEFFSDPKNRKKHSLAVGGTGIPGELTPYGPEWDNKLRNAIRKRDNWQCQISWEIHDPEKPMFSVHHIDYDKQNHDPLNLITLCTSCHLKTNGSPANRKKWTAKLQKLMQKRVADGEITAEGLKL